jgi:ATP-dependent Zn protease
MFGGFITCYAFCGNYSVWILLCCLLEEEEELVDRFLILESKASSLTENVKTSFKDVAGLEGTRKKFTEL